MRSCISFLVFSSLIIARVFFSFSSFNQNPDHEYELMNGNSIEEEKKH